MADFRMIARVFLRLAGLIIAAATATALSGQMQQGAPKGKNAVAKPGVRTLSYEGATTIGTKIMPEVAKVFAARTGASFSQIGGAGADAGFRAAEERRVYLGGVARELTPAEKAKVAGAVVIGYDAMGVFVNSANPVKSLTRAQLKEIFTGRAKNWKAFGGRDAPITVYSEKLSGGRATVKAFKDMVLGSDAYGPVKELEDATDCIKDVSADENGITASSMSFAVPGVRAVAVDGAPPTASAVQNGSYSLKRPLILVTKDPPAGEVKAFLDFMLTPEAQAIVARNFIPAK